MREIKFRVWDKQERNMRRVNAIDLKQHEFLELEDFDAPEGATVSEVTLPRGRFPENFELMQFTGLLDKNGKEIWESDILCVTSNVWCCTNEPLVVVWLDTGYWGLKRANGTQFHTSLAGVIGSAKLEIIGNIHENPELLGDKND